MKIIHTILIFSLFASLFTPPLAHAIEFDPTYILSDEELQDSKSMNQSEIQSFLSGVGSYLSKYTTKDLNGKTKKASEIIANAAKDHNINPKYLLVKLQKEQSLITLKNPSQKKLDGATGYGIDESCGWSCQIYLNNKGFGKQVDSAAGIMRWYYDNQQNKNWIKKKGIS